jgi:hypothetical protein
MPRWFRRALLLIPILGVAVACGSDSSSSSLPTPSTPLPTVLTETFSGVLNRNSGYTHPFVVSQQGDVTVFLLTSTDSSNPSNDQIPIGVSLGTWNGTSCAIVVASDNVAPGGSLIGHATAAGNLCVRVYDVGFVPGSDKYELLVDHY